MGLAESRLNIREIRAIRFLKEFLRFLRFPRLKVRKNIVPLQSILLEFHIL